MRDWRPRYSESALEKKKEKEARGRTNYYTKMKSLFSCNFSQKIIELSCMLHLFKETNKSYENALCRQKKKMVWVSIIILIFGHTLCNNKFIYNFLLCIMCIMWSDTVFNTAEPFFFQILHEVKIDNMNFVENRQCLTEITWHIWRKFQMSSLIIYSFACRSLFLSKCSDCHK